MRNFLIFALVIATFVCNEAVFAQSPKASEAANLEQTDSTARSGIGRAIGDRASDIASDKNSGEEAAVETQNPGSSSSSSSSRLQVAPKERLPNLRALLNIIANAAEILGLALGVPACLLVPVGLFFVWQKSKRWYGLAMILFGPTVVIVALAIPGLVELLFNAVVGAAKFD